MPACLFMWGEITAVFEYIDAGINSTEGEGSNMATKVTIKQPTAAPADFTPGRYNGAYETALNNALNTVTNWRYDPMQDASYQALAKVYGKRGNIAAKNTLADAAALNGGFQTSYAVSAAQQARNQYNQELAALIPDLENTAYNRAQGTLSALRAADDTAYGRYRDTESDRQWAWTQQYNKYRDMVGDMQWGTNFNYQIDRDAVSDSQWNQNFAYQKQRDAVADSQWAQEFALKKSDAIGGGGSGGGGGGRSGSGGGGSYGSYSNSGGGSNNGHVLETIRQDQERGKKLTAQLKKQQRPRANGGR